MESLFINMFFSACFSMYFVYVSVCVSLAPSTLSAPPNSDFSLQQIIFVHKLYLLSFMWYFFLQIVFLRVKLILSQIIKKGDGGGGVFFMQTVNGIQYCLSIENVHCLFPCYFCSLHLSVQNHNKDLAVSFFGVAFCTCAFPQCTVLNCFLMSPSSLPPRKNI